jgi:hypothetical protein
VKQERICFSIAASLFKIVAMQFMPKWILLLKNHISKILLQKVGMNISRLLDDSDWVF